MIVKTVSTKNKKSQADNSAKTNDINLPDYEADAAVYIAETQAQLKPFLIEQLFLEREIEMIENMLLQKKETLKYLSEKVIPCLDASGGSSKNTMSIVLNYQTKTKVDCSISKPKEKAAIAWLKQQGYHEKIKTETRQTVHQATLKSILLKAVKNNSITKEEKKLFSAYVRQITETSIS